MPSLPWPGLFRCPARSPCRAGRWKIRISARHIPDSLHRIPIVADRDSRNPVPAGTETVTLGVRGRAELQRVRRQVLDTSVSRCFASTPAASPPSVARRACAAQAAARFAHAWASSNRAGHRLHGPFTVRLPVLNAEQVVDSAPASALRRFHRVLDVLGRPWHPTPLCCAAATGETGPSASAPAVVRAT